MTCSTETAARQRKFWTLQRCTQKPGPCDQLCSVYGLKLTSGRYETSEAIKSLALLILMTDGNSDECLPAHGPRGGHWSQAFTGANTSYGSSMRRVKAGRTVAETVALIKAAASADLGKLLTYGVATEVEVDVKYSGANQFALVVKIVGPGGRYEFDTAGVLSNAEFIWN